MALPIMARRLDKPLTSTDVLKKMERALSESPLKN